MRKQKGYIVAVLLIVIISAGLLSFRESNDFKLVKNIEIFSNLFRELNYFYVDETDPEKMIQTGINAMLKTLDPYTVYIPESDLENFRFMTTGQYGGVGSLIRIRGEYTMIAEIYEGFPADRAGLKTGDIIIEINGVSIKNMNTSRVSELLKGIPNSDVSVTVERFGVEKPVTCTITRKEIVIPNVPYYGMIDENTGYIRLSNFTTNAGDEVKAAFNDLKKTHHAESIILDLRGNPGGLLVEAVRVSNLFVDKGNEIVSTRGKAENNNHTYIASNNPVDVNIPLAILVDRGSASAAEIVAGAMQDLDRGVVFGERTFGKGLVQTTRPLGYNNQLKVTTAKYYIPSGRCIQALDYTHRNKDGSVGYIPDSLISEFKTSKGRTVRDGGGIMPDVPVDPENAQSLTVQLYAKDMFFDYATQYTASHSVIAPAGEFITSSEDYAGFITFVLDSDFKYQSRSEKTYEKLIREAKEEGFYELHAGDFENLKKSLQYDVKANLEKFEKEISRFLTNEIAGRYYYQAGKIHSSLSWDEDIQKALEILGNKELYSSILNPDFSEKIIAGNAPVPGNF